MTTQKTKNRKKRQKTEARDAMVSENISNSPTYGITTRLTVGQFVCRLFDEQVTKRRSDERLIYLIRKEFPGREGIDYERYISMYRNIYNRGEWPCQRGIVPANTVARYDAEGHPMETKHGPPPRL
jgi:hypothetical protein